MRPADRRAVILTAATTIFAENSYEQASMRAVAAASGITTPVLYDHFGAKGTLHAEVLESQRQALLDYWSARAQPKSARKAWLAGMTALFEWIEHNPHGWQVLESTEDHPVEDVIAELLYALPYRTLDKKLDRDRMARVVARGASAVVGVVAAWWQRSEDITREEAAALTADLLWKGLEPVAKKKKKP
jgi:AcrR family transcriptional regulator